MIDLEEGKRLLAAATPGPWVHWDDGISSRDMIDAPDGTSLVDTQVSGDIDQRQAESNAAAIVWAVNNAAALIERADKAEWPVAWQVAEVSKAFRLDVERIKKEHAEQIAALEAEVEWLKNPGHDGLCNACGR